MLALLSLAACAGGNAASKLANAPEYQPKDQTKCSVGKSQARPLIVEWPSSDRLELENKVQQGVVAVRYVGCEMEVLARCTAGAQYRYLGGTRKVDKVVMKDADDLYANLPVGAAKLEGKLERSGQLAVDMNLVGRYEAEKPSIGAGDLQGDCQGATHFIYGVSVGAFDFYAGGQAKVGGGAGVGNVGVGASSQADRESLTKDGDVAACESARDDDKEPPHGCRALLRVEVVPLGEAVAAAPVCPGDSRWDGARCVGTPAENDNSTASTVRLISGITMAVGATVGAVTGILAFTSAKSVENQCSGNSCPSNQSGAADTSKTFGNVANVSLVVAGVGLAVWLATPLFSSSSPQTGATGSSPRLDVGPGAVTISGSF